MPLTPALPAQPVSVDAGPFGYRITLQPNCSLTAKGAWLFMLSVAAAPLSIAVGLTILGFWPVLPFAGLEVIGVGTALWITRRRARQRQVILIDQDRVTVLLEESRTRRESVFARHWAKVTLRTPKLSVAAWPWGRNHAGRLNLKFFENAVAGRHLTERQERGRQAACWR